MNDHTEKVIFISMSSPAAFRNLFFFPGSLFDRLEEAFSRGPGFSVVLVMSPHARQKYDFFFAARTARYGDRLRIEVADVPAAKSIPQRVFYFFYSYLVYTGTTRIMATLGTRPDEPPAGGRYFLAPLKILIAKTLGRSAWIKRVLVPRLWLSLFTERPFAAIFDRVRPDAVFITHLYGWFDTLLIAEAKRRGIRTIGMPAGWDHLDKYFLPFHADRLLVASGQVKRMAVEYQAYDPAAIATVGYPHFDFIARRDFLTSREALLRRLGFPSGAKYFLYVSGSAYCPDEPDIIETILQWADDGRFGADAYLVIRPYLGGRGRDKAFDAEKFNRFASHPRVVFYRKEFWGDMQLSLDFMNILGHADAVIALYTTMVVEAAVLDRPLVAPAFDGYRHRPYRRSIRRFMGFDHFREVLAVGALRIAYNFDELFSFLDGYLKNPRLDAEARERLRQEICGPLDGATARRILDEIIGNGRG
ncbi:MAG: CDP-glycerol glycerophosphotransferase family protein [Patescibacteria group bacterium]